MRLDWLINPQDQEVEIYRPGQAMETVQTQQLLPGDSVLLSFVLDLAKLFA